MAATQGDAFSNVIHADFGGSRAAANQRRRRRASGKMSDRVRNLRHEALNLRSELIKLDAEIKSLARSLAALRDAMSRITVAAESGAPSSN